MNRHQRRANAKRGRMSNNPRAEAAAASLPPAAANLLQVGIAHYRAGRLAEAEACYRRVLVLQPGHSVSHYNLGVVLQEQGKLDEAIAAYRRAIRITPQFALPYCNLGNVLKGQGKLKEATAAFFEAIRLDPDFMEAHYNLGIALREQGRFDEAIAACRRAIKIKPDFAEAHRRLGNALQDQGKADEAIDAYRKAIALKPDLAAAHNDLGLALVDLGRFSEARESLEQAIRLTPGDPKYRLNASNVTRFVVGDPRLAELERLAEDAASHSMDNRIGVHFALAKAFDDLGRHADAFRHWLDGNALYRQQIDYDEATTLEEMDSVRSVYTREFIQASQGGGHPTSVPVFIVGMPRSGSTLVEQILASHPQVFGGGELPYFRNIVEKTLTAPAGSAPTGKDIIGARYLAAIEQLAPDAAHITDKLPRNFIFAGLIHLTLPNAPIIHTIRDPIDTCLSCFSKLFSQEQDFTFDLAELGRYYQHYQDLMAHWHKVLPPGRILDVRYEDVIADLEGQARRLVAHCGLDWDPRCLEFHKTERPVRTASAMQVRQPLYHSAIGRWQVYAEFLGPLLAELGLASESAQDRSAAATTPNSHDGPTKPPLPAHQ